MEQKKVGTEDSDLEGLFSKDSLDPLKFEYKCLIKSSFVNIGYYLWKLKLQVSNQHYSHNLYAGGGLKPHLPPKCLQRWHTWLAILAALAQGIQQACGKLQIELPGWGRE